MEMKELMVGNIVSLNGKPIRISGIKKGVVSYGVGLECLANELDPIPLDPSIFYAKGWEETKNIFLNDVSISTLIGVGKVEWDIGYHVLHAIKYDGDGIERSINRGVTMFSVDYVHQYQQALATSGLLKEHPQLDILIEELDKKLKSKK